MDEKGVAEKLKSLSAEPICCGVKVVYEDKPYEFIYEKGKLWLPVKRKPKELYGFEWCSEGLIGVEVDVDKVIEALERFGKIYGDYGEEIRTSLKRSQDGFEKAQKLVKLDTLRVYVLFIPFGALFLLFLSSAFYNIMDGNLPYSVLSLFFSLPLFISSSKFYNEILNTMRVRFDMGGVYFNDGLVPKQADILLWADLHPCLTVEYGGKRIELPPAYVLPFLLLGYYVREDVPPHGIIKLFYNRKRIEDFIEANIVLSLFSSFAFLSALLFFYVQLSGLYEYFWPILIPKPLLRQLKPNHP